LTHRRAPLRTATHDQPAPAPSATCPPNASPAATRWGLIVRDAYPVSLGHTLIIPRRHVGSFFELTPDERAALLALLDEARDGLARSHQPAAWNIGINDGPARRPDRAAPAHPPDPALRGRCGRPAGAG
jgi:hypothetical protein